MERTDGTPCPKPFILIIGNSILSIFFSFLSVATFLDASSWRTNRIVRRRIGGDKQVPCTLGTSQQYLKVPLHSDLYYAYCIVTYPSVALKCVDDCMMEMAGRERFASEVM